MFAATCVLLAALGHVLMSGATIPWWTLVAAFGGIAAAAWVVARRERGVPVVVFGTVAAQTALHTAFSYAQAAAVPSRPVSPPAPDPHAMHHMAHDTMPMPMAADGTHLHHGMQVAAEGSSPAGHQMTGTASLGMLVAHLVAALLCGLWLAYGERAAFRILRAAAGWLLLPLRLVVRPPVPMHRPSLRLDHWVRPFRQYLLVHAITSRGPPRGVSVP